ncbi:hypothetical protein ACM0CQ_02740 [Mycobacteroides abscessus subsp. abscessus]|uniref:hypothetical protein n=1 Tax=Mycobacteroides abscessus TaxID=36809 RepID=UPI0039EE9D81
MREYIQVINGIEHTVQYPAEQAKELGLSPAPKRAPKPKPEPATEPTTATEPTPEPESKPAAVPADAIESTSQVHAPRNKGGDGSQR